MVNLDRRNGSCNTLDDPFCRISVVNKREDLISNVFNMITRINESKTYHANVNVNLMKENLIQIKSGTTINADVSANIQKSSCVRKRLHLYSKYMYLWEW